PPAQRTGWPRDPVEGAKKFCAAQCDSNAPCALTILEQFVLRSRTAARKIAPDRHPDPTASGPERDPLATASVPRFRAEHIGSLLRPKKLREAYRSLRGGQIGSFEFDPIRDQAIKDALALQEQLGFQLVTDGEFRRASYWSHLVGAIEGLTVRPSLFDFRDAKGEKQAFIAPHVSGRVARARSLSGEEYGFTAKATKRTVKITLPSPSTLHFWRGREAVNPAAYRDLKSFFDELAGVFRAELAELGKQGCTYV